MKSYQEARNTPSDVNQHMETLRDLAKECTKVVEMGMRDCVTTWAFIEGLGKGSHLFCIDLEKPTQENFESVDKACKKKGIEFTFLQADTRTIKLDGVADMIFIDTEHTTKCLRQELKLHAHISTKYLAFHDTESCHDELWPAIADLLWNEWKIKKVYINNNGLTICQRV